MYRLRSTDEQEIALRQLFDNRIEVCVGQVHSPVRLAQETRGDEGSIIIQDFIQRPLLL